MNFTEVVSAVIATTKRPEKVIEIRRYVNAAINFCSTNADFQRDMDETSAALVATSYTQSLALSLFANFRKFKYIKPDGGNFYIKPLDPDKIFNKNCETKDKYYIAGDNVIFKTSALWSHALVGWYKYPPNLTDASGVYWMITEAPYMIIDKACARVFKDIGDEKSAEKHDAEFRVVYLAFCNGKIDTTL